MASQTAAVDGSEKQVDQGGRQPLLKDAAVTKSPSRAGHVFRTVIVIFGASLVALLSATPNAFNSISGQFQDDTGTSGLYVALLLGVGVAGLQFTLPAGILIDRFGPAVSCLVGMICVVGAYIAMSVCKNSILLLITYAVAALGSGTTFLSALSTAIGMRHPIGIAMVSLTMSLSISFTVLMDKVWAAWQGCDNEGCWRQYVRVWSVVCAAVFLFGGATLFLRPTPASSSAPASRADDEDEDVETATEHTASHARATSTGTNQSEPLEFSQSRARSTDASMSLRQSARIFKKPFFLALFFANTIGLGSGILVITSALQLWEEYNTDHTKNHWNELVTVYFSIFSASFNVISPVVSDYLHRKAILRRSRYLSAVLGLVGVDFLVLGVMTQLPHNHKGACHLKMAFVFLLAGVGAGFGTFLTVLPTLLEDTYGMTNFGTFMSYMQFGSTAFAVVVPTVTSAVQSAFHSYNSLYFVVSALLVLACLAVGVPKPASSTFGAAVKK